MVSPEIRALFETDPARAVDLGIKGFVSTSPVNRLPPEGEMPIFDEPLVRFAAGDDPLYTEYKSIIDPTHLTPQEAVAQALDREPEGLPALSVVSWVLPITEDTRASNRKEKTMPSRRWSYTRWYGEKFNDALRQRMVDVLTDVGAAAVSPVLQPYFTQTSSEKTGLFSVWQCDNGPAASGERARGDRPSLQLHLLRRRHLQGVHPEVSRRGYHGAGSQQEPLPRIHAAGDRAPAGGVSGGRGRLRPLPDEGPLRIPSAGQGAEAAEAGRARVSPTAT
jgi:hypothetical protein